jgi:signal transduction histidine kinase
MDGTRAVGGAVVTLTGGALGAVMLRALLAGGLPPSGAAIAAFGLLVGAGTFVGGGLLYRSDFSTGHVLRVAGWNVLGVVVTSAVLALVYAYQLRVGGDVAAPLLTGATVVGVSVTAHLLIGINDVTRIRSRALARERKKSAVTNRLVRHNLRSKAQVLLGLAHQVSDHADGDRLADVGDRIEGVAAWLGETNEQMTAIQGALDATDADRRPTALDATVRAAVDAASADGAVVETDVPDLSVDAGDHLERAVYEAVENAITHHDGETPRVEVTARQDDDGWVDLRIGDDGPGLPEGERAVVTGEREVTPLEHGSGLGLWVMKWVVESYGGTVEFPDADAGTTVSLRLRRAA